jgi:hypothetical protein
MENDAYFEIANERAEKYKNNYREFIHIFIDYFDEHNTSAQENIILLSHFFIHAAENIKMPRGIASIFFESTLESYETISSSKTHTEKYKNFLYNIDLPYEQHPNCMNFFISKTVQFFTKHNGTFFDFLCLFSPFFANVCSEANVSYADFKDILASIKNFMKDSKVFDQILKSQLTS